MNTNKFLTGTLVGGITYFLLGYLIYGLLLTGFFTQHSAASAGSMKPLNEIVWWALIFGNLAGAALLTYVFLKQGNVKSFSTGASMGASIGFFMALSIDFIRYGTENTLDLIGTFGDVAAGTVMSAITGGVIGALLGMGKKPA